MRTLHYSRRTERAYVAWIRRHILFQRERHPETMGEPEVSAFLLHLATRGRVSASTQNQALAALIFLYRHVLKIDLPCLENLVRAKRPVRLPVVLSRAEVARLFSRESRNARCGRRSQRSWRHIAATSDKVPDLPSGTRAALIRC